MVHRTALEEYRGTVVPLGTEVAIAGIHIGPELHAPACAFICFNEEP